MEKDNFRPETAQSPEESEKQVYHARMLSSGQVIIPVELRRKLGLTDGTIFEVSIDTEGLHLRPTDTIDSSMLPKAGRPRTLSPEEAKKRQLERVREANKRRDPEVLRRQALDYYHKKKPSD
jgi:AbrB family looped-hinge helix DNA binding protein